MPSRPGAAVELRASSASFISTSVIGGQKDIDRSVAGQAGALKGALEALGCGKK